MNTMLKTLPLLVCAATSTARAEQHNSPPDFVTRGADNSRTQPAPEAPASTGTRTLEPADVIAFDLDSSRLDAVDEIELAHAARWQRAHPTYALVIEAHTDASGGDVYNAGLAARRAHAVQARLASLGVPRARLVMAVYGAARPPVASNPYAAANRVVNLYATRLPAPVVARRSVGATAVLRT